MTPIRENATDDYGLPIGPEGARRFPTSKPEADGPMKGSTTAAILGRKGYEQWARDMKERGQEVPAWESGKPYRTEAADVVDRLIQDQADKPEAGAVAEGAKSVVDRLISEDDGDGDDGDGDDDDEGGAPEVGEAPRGIQRIADNLENGNLTDAKAQAKRYSARALYTGFVSVGMSTKRAEAAATYLKGPTQETYQRYCDAK